MSRSLTAQIDLEQELRRISPGLSARLDGVRKAVNKMWEVPYLHWYTDHGPQHSGRVIDLIGQILCPLCLDYLSRRENNFPLSDYELYILLAACYLHDIGMQDLKIDERSVDELRPSDWEEIRKRHPQCSFEIIRDRTIKPRQRHTIDLGLTESDKDDSLMPIALVCMAHGSEYFELALRTLQKNLYYPAGKPIRGDLLAALLMMGDEIDLHKSRANLPDDSKAFSPFCLLHHYKHTFVSSVAVQDGKSPLDRQVVVGFLFPPQARDSYDGDLIAWVVNKIEEQAHRTQGILLSATKGQLRWDEKPVVAKIRHDEYGEREMLPDEVWEVLQWQLKEVPGSISVRKNDEEKEKLAADSKPLFDTARPVQAKHSSDILVNELLPKAALKEGYLQIEGQVVQIEKSKVLIGRSRDCDISLRKTYYRVSSKHARVIWKKEGFIILDGDGVKASRFGTFVNSKQVDSISGIVLRDGDHIVLGGLKSSTDEVIAEPDQNGEDIARLEELIDIHEKNLHEFERRKAQYGLNSPIEIMHGIEHERREISRLRQELVKHKGLAKITEAIEGACVLFFKSEGNRTT